MRPTDSKTETRLYILRPCNGSLVLGHQVEELSDETLKEIQCHHGELVQTTGSQLLNKRMLVIQLY